MFIAAFGIASLIVCAGFDAKIAAASQKLESGDIALAQELIAEAIDRDAKNANAWLLRGRIRMRQRKFSDAIEDLSVACALIPTPRAHCNCSITPRD